MNSIKTNNINKTLNCFIVVNSQRVRSSSSNIKMGSIYYKFKSSKNSSRVNIDGTSLSVFDLKREILLSNRMAINKGNDFDLVLLRDTPGQEGSLLVIFFILSHRF